MLGLRAAATTSPPPRATAMMTAETAVFRPDGHTRTTAPASAPRSALIAATMSASRHHSCTRKRFRKRRSSWCSARPVGRGAVIAAIVNYREVPWGQSLFQLLDSCVARVGDVERAFAIDGDAARHVDVPGCGP